MVTGAIDVQKIDVKRNNQLVLKNTSLQIVQGTFNFIVGGNGTGKSTLIKTILGLIHPEQGHIRIYGRPNSQPTVSQYIGYVPQYTDIDRNFPISVQEVIELECSPQGHCEHGLNKHLKILGIEHLQQNKLSSLSGGEFQKVLIARALVSSPQILILDEPTNNLDVEAQQELYKLLRELQSQGKTIIVVTHDYQIIEGDKDNIWLVAGEHVHRINLEQLHNQKLIEHHHD